MKKKYFIIDNYGFVELSNSIEAAHRAAEDNYRFISDNTANPFTAICRMNSDGSVGTKVYEYK